MTPISNSEISVIEEDLKLKLPGLFHKLLVEEGYGRRGAYEIYDPRQIADIYEFHFEGEDDLFNKFFPFGCNNETQEVWIISVADEAAASIWYETHPDDYDEEIWLSYDEWVTKYMND